MCIRDRFKLPQEQGEGMVAYSNRILDIADECDLNDITQQEIMAMVFITHYRSPQFRQELRTPPWCGSYMAIHQKGGTRLGQVQAMRRTEQRKGICCAAQPYKERPEDPKA